MISFCHLDSLKTESLVQFRAVFESGLQSFRFCCRFCILQLKVKSCLFCVFRQKTEICTWTAELIEGEEAWDKTDQTFAPTANFHLPTLVHQTPSSFSQALHTLTKASHSSVSRGSHSQTLTHRLRGCLACLQSGYSYIDGSPNPGWDGRIVSPPVFLSRGGDGVCSSGPVWEHSQGCHQGDPRGCQHF